jgi:hypothetical protein
LDKKNKPDIENNPPVKKLRCINIDCVFNSANKPNSKRNFCSHPNLKVESNMADITIAICSEFRSKKDYRLEDKFTLVDLKTNEQIKVEGAPEAAFTHIEKVTQEDLEQSISEKAEEERKESPGEETKPAEETKQAETVYETPAIISAGESQQEIAEEYNLTSSKTSNFLILKRLYQPYLRRGIIFSIFFHLFIILILYISLVPKGEKNDVQPQQRIVVVEDIQTPKFEPPDIDKQKEEEKSQEIGENTQVVRPNIKPKNIKPKIVRPVDEVKDTTGLTSHLNEVTDSLKHLTDSLLALNQDTTKLDIPDSLKNFMPQNAIGMKLWYPKNWKLTDNRSLNLNLEQFKGVIINTDSLSDDPGAVSIFVQIDDPKHSAYNKTVFKNTFQMDDSLIIAFSTDPVLTGSQRISYKFFLFTDPTGQSNVFVNSETKKDLFDKYRKYIEAIVRSIQIVKNPTTPLDNKTTDGTSDK